MARSNSSPSPAGGTSVSPANSLAWNSRRTWSLSLAVSVNRRYSSMFENACPS